MPQCSRCNIEDLPDDEFIQDEYETLCRSCKLQAASAMKQTQLKGRIKT